MIWFCFRLYYAKNIWTKPILFGRKLKNRIIWGYILYIPCNVGSFGCIIGYGGLGSTLYQCFFLWYPWMFTSLFKYKWYMLDEITIVKWFIIFHILYIHVLTENPGNSFYGKFWTFLIDHFVKHICLISYECTLYIYVCLEKCKRIKKDWHFKPFDLFV